jgi:hypothetical protein
VQTWPLAPLSDLGEHRRYGRTQENGYFCSERFEGGNCGHGPAILRWPAEVSVDMSKNSVIKFSELYSEDGSLKIEKINGTCPSMTKFDVKRVSRVYVTSSCESKVATTHRSDSVMSNTVSQVLNPSATKASRYCNISNRSNSSLKSVILSG